MTSVFEPSRETPIWGRYDVVVFGAIRQIKHGVVANLLERRRALDGLRKPHGIFGNRIAAPTMDTIRIDR